MIISVAARLIHWIPLLFGVNAQHSNLCEYAAVISPILSFSLRGPLLNIQIKELVVCCLVDWLSFVMKRSKCHPTCWKKTEMIQLDDAIVGAETHTNNIRIFIPFDSIHMQLQLFSYPFTTTWVCWATLKGSFTLLGCCKQSQIKSKIMLICEFFWTKNLI